jgi:hypothetical protein
MKLNDQSTKNLSEAYLKIIESAVSQRILPKLGDLVTKKESQEDDKKEYVVVGIEPQGIWIYPLGNIDYTSTKAELVFTREINF